MSEKDKGLRGRLQEMVAGVRKLGWCRDSAHGPQGRGTHFNEELGNVGGMDISSGSGGWGGKGQRRSIEADDGCEARVHGGHGVEGGSMADGKHFKAFQISKVPKSSWS